MDFALLGGISFVADQFISPFSFPPIYKEASKIGESVPAAINGSIIAVGSYVAMQMIMNNRILPSELAGIVGGVSVVQLLGGMTIYSPLVSNYPALSPYLGSIMTAVGAVAGLYLIDYLL